MSSSSRIISLIRHARPRFSRSITSSSAIRNSFIVSDQKLYNFNGIFVSSPLRPFSTDVEKSSEDKETSEDNETSETAPPPPPATDDVKGEEMVFQAETRQLLDIVTNSLYTEKEVFLRELVSNCSDALEKLRHLQATDQTIDPEIPLEIRIDLDETTSSITISDTGVGMSRDELVQNLGTIARSGSKQFMQQVEQEMSEEGGADPSRGIIGKFGVGFYASFMVGEKVEVRSRSAMSSEEGPAQLWRSEGQGAYEVADLPEDIRQQRGSSVVIYLKEEHWDFCDEKRIEGILKRYSNFVNFPIFLNGKRVNTLEAIWGKDPKEVKEEEYTAFYKYIANAIDEPLDTYHFRADAPLDIKALFYIPSFHSEKYGMGRMEPGVSLYSRKVLIESKSSDIVPEWMRFVKGVVDSEDVPLAISREKPQDSALIKRLSSTLARKFIAHLTTMMKKDKKKYLDEFYKEYGFFLKEVILIKSYSNLLVTSSNLI